jgi:hypothetical protein
MEMKKNPYGKGWHFESKRHALASQGIETGRKVNATIPVAPVSNLPKWGETLSEQTLHLILRRLNSGKLKENEVPFPDDGEGIPLTPEQVEKGRAWLMNQWKTETGAERKNNPLGYREQEILNKFDTIKLKGFYDAGNMNFHFYVPLYEVEGDNTSFEYYVSGGQISIVG